MVATVVPLLVASELGMIVGSVLAFMSASFIIVTALTTSVTGKDPLPYGEPEGGVARPKMCTVRAA